MTLRRLREISIADGAPSARNLLVTLFGDAVRPHGAGMALSVRSLAVLLAGFDVNERLVRTSLTRLVNDGLLRATSIGRRSFYGVDPVSDPLFANADQRIYGPRRTTWDGAWTLVVIDASEARSGDRARLRQRLTWAGLGVVAPNVMASPVVPPEEAAGIVEESGCFERVLVTRSEVFDGRVTLGVDELARRCAPVDELADRYERFVSTFGGFGADDLEQLTDDEAFKLRVWLVASYRRVVLVDPLLPPALLPDGWAGSGARSLAASVYRAVAEPSERFLAAHAELPSATITPNATRLRGRFVVDDQAS